MPLNSLTIAIPAVLFLASLVRSTFGVGEALIAVPIALLLVRSRHIVQ